MNTSDKLRSLSIDRGAETSGAGAWPIIAGVATLAAVGMGVYAFVLRPAPAPATAPTAVASTAPEAGATTGTAPAGAATRPRGGLVASGYVIARRSATVSVDITGRLTSVLFEEGAIVEKGQLLAQLDDTLARYDVQVSRARVASARDTIKGLEAQLIEARAQRARAEALIASEAISRAALDAAVAQTDALSARLQASRADLRLAEASAARQAEFLDRHQVRAPFAGVIIAKNAQAGEILSPVSGGGQFTRTGVATLVDMTSLEVEVDVNEGQIADVRAGQSATIILDAYTDWEIPGEVIAIIPTANRDRATIQVRVGFQVEDPRILPEMAAKVTFDRSGT
jgi:RND family efflux transporter MFP subunit